LADVLEKGHPIEAVKQDNPPGVVAYQMTVDLGVEECPPVFIKVRLGAGKILGRSFHYVTVPGHEKRS